MQDFLITPARNQKLFPVLHNNFACTALTYTRQFTDEGYFLPIQSSSNKSHSSLLDLILLLHYFFISLFQSWCPQTVSFFLLSPSGTDASSLPYAINLWPASEKDIPPFSLTHHFLTVVIFFLVAVYFFVLLWFGVVGSLVFGFFWLGMLIIFLLFFFLIIEQYKSHLQIDATNSTYPFEQGRHCFFHSPQKSKCLPRVGEHAEAVT